MWVSESGQPSQKSAREISTGLFSALIFVICLCENEENFREIDSDVFVQNKVIGHLFDRLPRVEIANVPNAFLVTNEVKKARQGKKW